MIKYLKESANHPLVKFVRNKLGMTVAQREEYFTTNLLDKSFELTGKIIEIEPLDLLMETNIDLLYQHELNTFQKSFYSNFKYDKSLYSQVSNFKKGDVVTCTGCLKSVSYFSICDFGLTGIRKFSKPPMS